MRVKIGDTWYDAEDQWLAVQFTVEELECVKQLTPDSNRSFCAGRSDTDDELLAWVREGRDV